MIQPVKTHLATDVEPPLLPVLCAPLLPCSNHWHGDAPFTIIPSSSSSPSFSSSFPCPSPPSFTWPHLPFCLPPLPLSFIPTPSLSCLRNWGWGICLLGWEVIWMNGKLWMNKQPFLISSASPPCLRLCVSLLLSASLCSTFYIDAHLTLPLLASPLLILLFLLTLQFSFMFFSSVLPHSCMAMWGLLLCRLSAIIPMQRVHQVIGVCTCPVCRGDRMFLDAPGCDSSGGL